MSKSNILVGLVDDHPMMRAGLAAFIRSLRGYALVFEANSAEAAYIPHSVIIFNTTGIYGDRPISTNKVPIFARS